MTCPLLHPTGCGMCGKPLTGRKKRWCSRVCANQFRNNHRWTNAKDQARRAAAWYLCAHCGYLFQQHDVNVNHIEPCRGKHNQFGCWHHADNLEVVCVDCHYQETTRQRQEGEI